MALYSNRIGSKNLMITDHPENQKLCYKWTAAGSKKADGRQRYVCAGCRRMKDAKQVGSNAKLPARVLLNGEWQDDGPQFPHFCEPIERNTPVNLFYQ